MSNNGELKDDVWIDYVIGKAYMPYFEAKETTAKEWGINYEVKFVGCVVSDEIEAKEQLVEAANQKYFAKLAQKHGSDWEERFEIDVKKKLPLAPHLTDPVWEYTILGKPSMGYIEAKKVVAKKWNINLKPVFLGCVANKPGVQESRDKAAENSKVYLKTIESHYGENWQQHFNAEVKAYYEKNR